MRTPRALLLLLPTLACTDSADSGTPSDSEPAVDVERADCEVALDGVDWGDDPVVDHDPTIEARLDAVDYAAMDEEIDISELLALYRGAVAFAFEIPLRSWATRWTGTRCSPAAPWDGWCSSVC